MDKCKKDMCTETSNSTGLPEAFKEDVMVKVDLSGRCQVVS